MTTIETKEARLNELKAELAEIRAEMKDDSISNAHWGRLQNYRYEIRCEIEKLQAEIDAEIDANIEKVAAQKVDAILTSGVQPVIVNTTFKNNRCSVNIDGAKVSLDKAVTILCESELARRGENVLLINEKSDICPLDEDLFILGKHNVKTAIRQFARGEKVTGAKVLNGKFYPVVANAEAVEAAAALERANIALVDEYAVTQDATVEAEPAAEPAVEAEIVETANVEVKTASEMKAAYAASLDVVRVHFTAKGNPAWKLIYHYGLHDRETGYQRISKKEAADELANFGLTPEQVIAVQKAQDAINAEEREADKTARNDGRCYSRLGYDKVYQKALAMVFGEDEPAAVEPATAETEPVEEPAPVDIETRNRQAQLYAVSGKAFSAMSEALTPPVDCDDDTADQYESAYQTLKAARVHFSARRREFVKTNRGIIGQLKQLRKDAVNDRLHKVSAQVKAMFDAVTVADEPAPAPVEDRNLTRRESLELDKKVVMEELDEYHEGLLEAEADPDIPQSHIDFLNSSIERLLNEYYDICKQLDELDDEPKPAPVKYVATQITFPTGHEGEPTREVSKTFDNLDDAAKFIADDNPFIETETGYHTFAYDDGYFGGVYWAGYRIATTDGKILVEADIDEVKGDESIDRLVIKYINDNDNTVPEPPVNNPLACLNNLGYEDDVIEPVYGTVDETASSKEYAVTIAQLKDAYDSAVDAWCAIDYNARTNKKLRPAAKTALATVHATETALQAFGDAHLAQLRPLFDQTIRGATIRIINEDGIDWGSQKLADISLKFRLSSPDFAIIANDNYYATCATPDDVRRVVGRLTQAIVNGAPEFSFEPQDSTVADTPPAESDTVAGVARICATVNAAAPKGWEVYYDTPSKLFAVTHNDETVARLTSVELYDAWDAHPPEDFFDAYDTHDVVEFDADGNISAIWF